jgi:hypothetical protein
VTDNVNQEKGDSGPEEWIPPLGKLSPVFNLQTLAAPSPHGISEPSCLILATNDVIASYSCPYGKMWIFIKYTYGLTITQAEKSALEGLLDAC